MGYVVTPLLNDYFSFASLGSVAHDLHSCILHAIGFSELGELDLLFLQLLETNVSCYRCDLLLSVVLQRTQGIPGILHNAFLHLSANLFEIFWLFAQSFLSRMLLVAIVVVLMLLGKQLLAHLAVPLSEPNTTAVNAVHLRNLLIHLFHTLVDVVSRLAVD